jgi:hypothetical protein
MASRLTVTAGSTVITNPFNVTWTDPTNTLGNGQFTLTSDDSQVSAVTLGTLIKIAMDGVVATRFVVEQIAKTAVGGAEAAGQNITFSGRTHFVELERIIVYPAKALVTSTEGQTSGALVASNPWADQRLFGWADPGFALRLQESGAPAADVLATTGTDRPVGFPDGSGYWIGDSGGASEVYGAAYFGYTDTPSVAKKQMICWFAAKDEAELYFDGVLIAQVSASEIDPTRTIRVVFDITPGTTHVASVKVRKVSSSNALFAACFHEVGSSDKFFLTSRGGYWSFLGDPATSPGVTPGDIVLRVLDEAYTRGDIHGWTATFDATHDSAGNNWPIIPMFPVSVGATLVEVLDQLSAWVDWGYKPGSAQRELSMWNAAGVTIPGGTGVGKGSASGVTLAVGTNALEVVNEVVA